MADSRMPSRASNPDHANTQPWSSDANTVERRDLERPEGGGDIDDEIVNRSGAGMRTPRRYEERDEQAPPK